MSEFQHRIDEEAAFRRRVEDAKQTLVAYIYGKVSFNTLEEVAKTLRKAHDSRPARPLR